MKRIRLWLSGSFVVLLSFGFLTVRGGAQPGALRKIVDGVWFRQGDLEHNGYCNNAIIEMKDYLIVVDANFPGGARIALEDARGVSSKPVKYVFDTHHHGDHAYGNPIFTQAGAITLAYQGVVEEMKRYEPARFQANIKDRPDVADLKRTEPEPPKQTFSKSPYKMSDGSRTVEFRFLGWAHTRGDGFVFLPKEKVLCTGDAVVNGPYNYTADGNIGNWPKVVEAAMKLNPEHVLPGHGPAGGREVLEGQRAFMRALYSAVQKAVSSGKKMEDLVTMENGKPTKASLELSADVKNWVGDFYPAQVHDAFEEITQKKPHGDIPHE